MLRHSKPITVRHRISSEYHWSTRTSLATSVTSKEPVDRKLQPFLRTYYARFQVLTATSMKMAVIWDVAPCSLVGIDRPFRLACCLHHQGDDLLDDGGSKLLRNVVQYLPDYRMQHPRRYPHITRVSQMKTVKFFLNLIC
jgi:hypothetical protein